MRIGPPSWNWVSIDSLGVPGGGLWGHPRQFAEQAAAFGLYVAWSQIWGCFDIYSRLASGKIIHQFRCLRQDNQKPIPLNEDFLTVLVYLQNHTPDVGTLTTRYAHFRAAERYEEAKELAAQKAAMREELLPGVDLQLGTRTPRTTILVPARIEDLRN
ncbi:MAG TPA: hypothetical protein VMW52_10980 [Phycisphaerae bacterium]|nr:hypothetical protein [Phycisphaerae bacterium]